MDVAAGEGERGFAGRRWGGGIGGIAGRIAGGMQRVRGVCYLVGEGRELLRIWLLERVARKVEDNEFLKGAFPVERSKLKIKLEYMLYQKVIS